MEFYLVNLSKKGSLLSISEEFSSETDAVEALREGTKAGDQLDYCTQPQLLRNENGPALLAEWNRGNQ